jgi:DNA invertase Pin-like site-specific DNA recombinase
MRTIIYTRSRSGTGADASRQLEHCRAHAASRGWDVSEVFTDQGSSAFTLDRLSGAENVIIGTLVARSARNQP